MTTKTQRSTVWTCPECSTRNKGTQTACENCGVERPTASAEPTPSLSLGRCSADQAETLPDGWCPRGDGYAMTVRDGQGKLREVRCQFSCPVCRGPLGWEGACRRCHGSATEQDPATWTYPGDTYDLTVGRHWRLTARGPKPVASPAQVAGHLADFADLVTRIGRRP